MPILQKTGKYYHLDADSGTLRKNNLLGEGVTPQKIMKYKVFVQSMGSGVRHLKTGTDLLYASKVYRMVANIIHDLTSRFLFAASTSLHRH